MGAGDAGSPRGGGPSGGGGRPKGGNRQFFNYRVEIRHTKAEIRNVKYRTMMVGGR